MKKMRTLSRLLILALLVCGTVLSFVSCEATYTELTEQFREQNPQFTLPKDLENLPEQLPIDKWTDEIPGEITGEIPSGTFDVEIIPPPVPEDPCKDGHKVVIDSAVEPTCTMSGKTEGRHCGRCGYVLIAQKTISANGHSSSGWTTVYGTPSPSSSTLSVVGKCRYCLVCKQELERIPYTSIEVTSNFDGDGDGKEDVYTFSNYLPDRFLSAKAILINGGAHLDTDLNVQKAERIKDSGIWHYYINLSDKTIPDEMKSLTWEFEVLEDGIYDFCFDLGMKDTAEQRGNVMQIDDGEKRMMDYTVTYEFADAVRDETQGSYMTGISVELTAGRHVIRMTYNPLCNKVFHFRNIYLVKAS
ncbi:MAG: hypothetical protein E7629_06230 [Ruminococcaceae bacterium]|nr:hypothetical protein [Oscillospiraceae bacterium]